jgi:integrase
MATVYRENSKGKKDDQVKKSAVWSARVRLNGQDRYRSGFKSKREAQQWAREAEVECSRLDRRVKGLGPDRTTLALALRDYAREFVVQQKGASQAVTRINAYMVHAGLPRLKATALSGPRSLQAKKGAVLFALSEVTDAKPLPRTFAEHREKRLAKRANTLDLRRKLATMPVSWIAPHHLNDLKVAMATDGYSDSTIRQEIALLSAFFNRAIRAWRWKSLENPADDVDWPVPDNKRKRVLSLEEQERLAEGLRAQNPLAAPLVWFAIQTAMRRGELLYETTWSQVDWDERILNLRDSKGGSREVPLTREAVAVLESMPRGQPEERIFSLTEEALAGAWQRACKRAGIENLRIQDLRHTAATRHAARLNGNIFLLQLVTGHKTLSMLSRYVNPTARDVVKAFDATDGASSVAAAPRGLAGELPANEESFQPKARRRTK